MTDTQIVDGVVFAQDDGTGVSDGSEDYNSAGYFSLLAKYKGDGTYVGEDKSGSATLQFSNVDTTNEQVDIGTGYAYIMDAGNSVQSGSQTSYDTVLPVENPYVVILPNAVVDLQLDTDSVNDIWLAVDPTSNDSIYLRHGSGLSAPSDPSIKLGTVDTSSGSTTRANDLASSTFDSNTAENLTANNSVTDPDGVSHTAELADSGDIRTDEQIQDVVGGLLQANGNISVTYDDAADTLTIDTAALDSEEVQDAVDALLVGGTNTSLSYDDGGGTLTIDVDAPTEAEFNTHATRHEDGGADELNVSGLSGDLADEQDPKPHAIEHEDGGGDELNVGGLSGVLADAQTPQTEAVQDIVGGLIQANGNISVTYDDANDTLTVDTSALNEEQVEDAVAALVTAGNAITVNYDDANDNLSIAVDESALSFYDGTNLTAPVDNQSVTTEELYNDEEPTLDISRYDSQVLTKSHYRNDFVTSIDGWEQTVSGSGSVSLSASVVTLNTGTTSGSTVLIRLNTSAPTLTYTRDWSKSRVFSTATNIRDAATERVDYIGWGGPQEGNEAITFKIASGDLLGVVNDGGTETTTTLISGVGTGSRKLRFEHDGGSEVRFFVDGSQEGAITSGFPTGVAYAEIFPQYSSENLTAAQRRLNFKQFQAARAP